MITPVKLTREQRKLIEQLAPEHGFSVALKLDEYNNDHYEGVTAENFRYVLAEHAATARAAQRFAFRTGRFSLHIYARTPGRPDGADLRARMFSPLGGTGEDPATGSANGALIALLASLDPAADTALTLDVLQGVEIGRPSFLHVSAEKRAGAVTRVRVGGRCAPVVEGTLTV